MASSVPSTPSSSAVLIVACFMVLVTVPCITAELTKGDAVVVSVNKVWPFHNPFETYSYYDALPMCRPDRLEYSPMSIGQSMKGDRLANSLYTIQYLEPVDHQIVCNKTFSSDDLERIRQSIDKLSMFEFYVQDIPLSKPVGIKVTENDGLIKYFLVTSLHFYLGHNNGEVVSAKMDPDENLVAINPVGPMTVTFQYSVDWEPAESPGSSKLHQKLAAALTSPTSRLDIHWLAIGNSFVLVLLITSVLLLLILRIVKTDLAKYLRIPEEDLVAGEDETGWKLLHADVFRAPSHRMWFCACVGSGAHLFLVAVGIVLCGCFAPLISRGAILTIALFGYLLTSYSAGYISANIYRRLGGVQWVLNILVTVCMFMGPVFIIWSMLNLVALGYSSTAALPFSTGCLLCICWLFVTLPLTVLGAIIGRRDANRALELRSPFPCKTNRLAREIPMVDWTKTPWLHVLLSGLFPFSSIYIELHYVFMSVWGVRIYTLYGVLLTACVMLLVVAGTVSVFLTYLHLNAENYRWWWRALASGGSIAVYFLLYCAYYFFFSTRMFGLLQCAFFFGYSLIIAWALFLIMGFVTFTCNYVFVTYIYSSIKSD